MVMVADIDTSVEVLSEELIGASSTNTIDVDLALEIRRAKTSKLRIDVVKGLMGYKPEHTFFDKRMPEFERPGMEKRFGPETSCFESPYQFKFVWALSGITTVRVSNAKLSGDWFEDALALERKGNISAALDTLYQNMDRQLREGKFGEIEQFVANLDPSKLSIDMLLGVLILTRPAPRDKIPSREKFFERSWEVVESRKRDARKLLGGLRSPSRARQGTTVITASRERSEHGRRRRLLGRIARWFTSSPT